MALDAAEATGAGAVVAGASAAVTKAAGVVPADHAEAGCTAVAAADGVERARRAVSAVAKPRITTSTDTPVATASGTRALPVTLLALPGDGATAGGAAESDPAYI